MCFFGAYQAYDAAKPVNAVLPMNARARVS